ncbi:hypothetical protein FUAX_43990 (plasmid) [Fulvitalea axinellae]|uniref:FAS1 domain-containing protein n=1 Tax=Fulvitalea axinellae TaxID=1182444 RepID=A0AAU9CVK3_9BACT|nr:hypothetical protein FUAX_43990 [Fulvitalea axinellae]
MNRNKLSRLVWALAVPLLLSACAKEWEDHYEATPEGGELTVLAQLKASGYGEFAGLLEKADLADSLDMASSPFTVFAPAKGSLEALKSLPEAEQRKALRYHISPNLLYAYTVAGEEDLFLKSRYIKNVRLNKKSGVLTVNNNLKVTKPDIICKNGVIHELEAPLLPNDNIYEALAKLGDEYSVLRKYAIERDTLVFDKERSVAIGSDKFGRTVYDSAWNERKYYFEQVGSIADEDERFTFLCLSNEALEATYQGLVKRYYGDKINLPAGFEEDKKPYVIETILESTLGVMEYGTIKDGDTIRLSNGRKLVQSVQDFGERSEQNSNGITYFPSSVQVLMTDSITTVQKAEVEYFSDYRAEFSSVDLGIETPSSGGKQTLQIVSEEKGAWFEFTIEGLVAGKYAVVARPWATKCGTCEIRVDGEILNKEYKPRVNWRNDVLGFVTFDEFGSKKIRFTITDVDRFEDKYMMTLDNVSFVPVAE